MEQQRVAEIISENMKTIFTYSLSRVSNRTDAEDLAGDIVVAILSSASKLKDYNAFYGFIWAIAGNTYKKFLSRRHRIQTDTLDENSIFLCEDADGELLRSEEINLLRRELSLLSYEYRESTIAYYFEGMSCAEVSKKLNISLEMVKYYLFKTR